MQASTVHRRSPLIVVDDPCQTIKDGQPIRGQRSQKPAPSELELAHSVGSLDSHRIDSIFRVCFLAYFLLLIQYEPHPVGASGRQSHRSMQTLQKMLHRSMQLARRLASMTHSNIDTWWVLAALALAFLVAFLLLWDGKHQCLPNALWGTYTHPVTWVTGAKLQLDTTIARRTRPRRDAMRCDACPCPRKGVVATNQKTSRRRRPS